ncbi:MAG TPA: CHAD domain-containing protein [Anaerolineae bacterium]|nr:CHAD domain-containing protein [Anaerolineae bacterium]
MEIEAKFTLTSQAFDRLLEADRIAEYTIGEGKAKRVRDTYLDTCQQRLLAAGYACRRRTAEGKDGLLITLKGLGSTDGAVHRREELEVALEEDQPPSQWPPSAARDRVLHLIGDSTLQPIADVHQTRITKKVLQSDRQVAELSLDEWTVVDGGEAQTVFEAEVELLPLGTEEDLSAIVACLDREWDLTPETQSKFERALTLLQQAQGQGQLLTPRQRALCLQVASRPDMYGRRARALLALDDGATQDEAGLQAGLSERRVRYWLAAFRERQLGVLPPRVLAEAVGEAVPRGTEVPQVLAEIVTEATPAAQKEREQAAPQSKQLGLEADDLMVEAAHKVLSFHYRQMLKHETGTRAGEDIEELHDMRVATRRMRAAFSVFADYLAAGEVAPHLEGLKRTGRRLGAVRDLDVFWEKTGNYLEGLPVGREVDLEPLHVVWQSERERARRKMIAYLDSDRYQRFKEAFSTFLESPRAGGLPVLSGDVEPRPHRLRFVVPLLVYERLAAGQAYEGWVTGPHVPLERLHALRIAAKGLRYTLEFFEEVLGAEARPLVEQIKGLQDHLGDLQDAVVASGLLRDFLTWGTWGPSTQGKKGTARREPIVAPGVAAYLAARQAELQELINTFPQTWALIQAQSFRERIAACISQL